MTLKVSGVYHRDYDEGEMNVDSDIFTKYRLLTDPRYTYEPVFQASFFLKNPRDLDAFAQEAYAAGMCIRDSSCPNWTTPALFI